MILKKDCKYFRGDVPCLPHKKYGVHCDGCEWYEKINKKVLIIKLGAAGDVIRTTPLLRKIKNIFPSAQVAWITDFPEFLPEIVNETLQYNEKNLLWLLAQKWDIVYNLDKDKGAIALSEKLNSEKKFGFGMDQYGRCKPLNEIAKHKFMTGIFDDISRHNKKSYLEEIFELCDFKFNGEKYIFEKTKNNNIVKVHNSKMIVGLNTGCGKRWPSRLWPDDHWIELARLIQERGQEVLWLGGLDEHEKNVNLQKKTGGIYYGYYPLDGFIEIVNQCKVVITQVTMALHLAIGLEKRVVLMNNIFNKHEFELYGLGEIVEPPIPCGCYFNPVCIHESMQQITPAMIYSSIERQLNAIDGGRR